MKNRLFKTLVIVAMLINTQIWAAKPIRPPVKVLVNPNNRVAVVEAKSDIESGKATFMIKKSLYGDDSGEISLQLNANAQNNYTKNQDYLVVYSYVMKEPVVRDEKVTDPNGPRVLNYFFLDAAMFHHNAGIEKMFAAQIGGKNSTKEQYLDWLISNLEEPHELNQQVAVFEFNMRRELYAHLTEQHIDRIKKVFEAQSVDNELMTILLKTLPGVEKVGMTTWLQEQSRKLIKQHGAQVDFTSYVPGLVQEAIIFLGEYGIDADQSILKDLLFSNHPGIARESVKSLFAINSVNAKKLVASEVNNKSILADARQAIKQNLN